MLIVLFGALDELVVQNSAAGLVDLFDEHPDRRCAVLIIGLPVAFAAQRQELLWLVSGLS